MADITVSTPIDNFMQAATGDEACDAIGAAIASEQGTMAARAEPTMVDLAATTELPRGQMPFQYNYFKVLSGNLTLTDAATPTLTEGHGHRITFYGDSAVRTITVPSSLSAAQGGNITFFYVLPNEVVTIVRQYINGGWNILGDPAPKAAGEQYQAKLLQDLGVPSYVCHNIDVDAITTAASMSSGTLYLTAVRVPTVKTITTFGWYMWTDGNYSASGVNNRLGLYKPDGAGNIDLVASSTNSANTWQSIGNTTWASRALSSTYVAQPGTYYIAALYMNDGTQTTQPQVGGRAALSNSAIGLPSAMTNSNKLFATYSGQTDLPSQIVMSNTTASTSVRHFHLR